jgi:chromosome segregation ATPase
MGLSADTLLSSAQYYLDILKKKEDEFNDALEGHSKNSILAKEKECQDIDAQMSNKAEQIKSLTEEISTLQKKKVGMMAEVMAAKAETEKVRNNFYLTLKVFTSRISSDIEKIKSYISSGGK